MIITRIAFYYIKYEIINRKSEIFLIRLGLNSCYLIRGKEIVLVDGSLPGKRKVFKRLSFPRFTPDILITDKPWSLKPYGIEGNIIHTPGHTPGSISVILDSGEAFVGCMAHNGFPFRIRPGLPIYALDVEEIKKEWKILIGSGIKMIYPGHGKPFQMGIMKKALG